MSNQQRDTLWGCLKAAFGQTLKNNASQGMVSSKQCELTVRQHQELLPAEHYRENGAST